MKGDVLVINEQRPVSRLMVQGVTPARAGIIFIPGEKWFAKKYKPFFTGITDLQWFAKMKIRKPLETEYTWQQLKERVS